MANDKMRSEKVNLATAPTDGDGRVYHLHLAKGDVPPYMILPGAPERTELIAKSWDNANEIAFNREYRTFTGQYEGVTIGTTSTGIGAASSEICIHELNTLGVHTCLRIGTTGVIQPEFNLGDLIIPCACYRKDGTSDNYIDPAYPAAADTTVTMALMQACDNLGYRYGVGIGYTAASFYIGQGRPLGTDDSEKGGYWPSFANDLIPDLASAGIINIEMEAAGQFVVGRLHGMRMGAIFAVVANRITNCFGDEGGEEKTTKAASEAVKILHGWDDSGVISLKLRSELRISR